MIESSRSYRTTAKQSEVSATRAQNEFGRLLDRAISGERVVITRHGRAAAVLISADDYAALAASERLPPGAPYTLEPHASGRCLIPSLDRLHDALVRGEGETYR